MTLNLCLLPPGSRLRTRDGRSARLLATDLKHPEFPVAVVLTNHAGFETVETVTADGRWMGRGNVDEADIVSVEEPGDA